MVVTVGLATGSGEVVLLNPLAGVQVYDNPGVPDVLIVKDAPLQIVVSGVSIESDGFTTVMVTLTLAGSQPEPGKEAVTV